jgi:hypothetical protein
VTYWHLVLRRCVVGPGALIRHEEAELTEANSWPRIKLNRRSTKGKLDLSR